MFFEACLSKRFWREVVSIAIYIINKAKLRVNSDTSPYDLCKGKLASVKYFKIFGSKCFMKINEDNPGKLNLRADEGIFLGYLTVIIKDKEE